MEKECKNCLYNEKCYQTITLGNGSTQRLTLCSAWEPIHLRNTSLAATVIALVKELDELKRAFEMFKRGLQEVTVKKKKFKTNVPPNTIEWCLQKAFWEVNQELLEAFGSQKMVDRYKAYCAKVFEKVGELKKM